eukprot:GHVQ01023048.1.p1 GENE.GHVQ01023048.1~~GHVQ01023048.1.p1  ORF type:complete len:429 (-),score=51.07 GHVQ01023048.1:959-2062(-)
MAKADIVLRENIVRFLRLNEDYKSVVTDSCTASSPTGTAGALPSGTAAAVRTSPVDSSDYDGPVELRHRVELYVIVFKWLLEKYRTKQETLMVGMSAPQGCGKTTLGAVLQHLFSLEAVPCVAVSLDDFYLPHDELRILSPDNPLLHMRGNPGTHDVSMLCRCMQQLKDGVELCVRLPGYDKAARQGQGDRSDAYKEVHVKDIGSGVVLLEGWMMGFRSISDDEVTEESIIQATEDVLSDLPRDDRLKYWREVNRYLSGYHDVWDMLDVWVVFEVACIDWIFKWRLEQERGLARKKGDKVMEDQEVADFVTRFLPAYKIYLPNLYGRSIRHENRLFGPGKAERQTDDGTTLHLRVDERRWLTGIGSE